MRAVTICVAVSTIALFQTCPAAGEEQYVVQVAVKKGTASSDKQADGVQVLAEPRLAMTVGRQATYRSGGEAQLGDERIPLGTLMKLRLEPENQTSVVLSGVIESSERLSSSEGLVSRQSLSVYLRRAIEIGRTTQIPLSDAAVDGWWLEITIDRATQDHGLRTGKGDGSSIQASAHR